MGTAKRLLSTTALIASLLWLATAAAGERFTDNGDGTVSDHQQQLMWARTDNQGDIDHLQAERWVRYTFPDTVAGGAYHDWRLPTLAELKSLHVAGIDYDGYETDCGQRVKIVPQIRLTCGWLWTGEVSAITATVFNFQRGIHYSERKVHKRAYRVLPVRSLK